MFAYRAVESELAVKIAQLLALHALDGDSFVAVELNGIFGIVVTRGDEIYLLPAVAQLIELLAESDMALIFAAVDKVARDENYIRAFVARYLLEAGVDNGWGLRHAFLIRLASLFICASGALERAVVIVRIGHKIKAEVFHKSPAF